MSRATRQTSSSGSSSLEVLHRGILEGRRASGNMMKYLLMGTSSNFGNMFSMAVASAFLPFLPMLPAQILLNNFLYDLAQITIPTDHVDRSYISRPQRWDISLIRDFMLCIGPDQLALRLPDLLRAAARTFRRRRRCFTPAGSSTRSRRRRWCYSSSVRRATR